MTGAMITLLKKKNQIVHVQLIPKPDILFKNVRLPWTHSTPLNDDKDATDVNATDEDATDEDARDEDATHEETTEKDATDE